MLSLSKHGAGFFNGLLALMRQTTLTTETRRHREEWTECM